MQDHWKNKINRLFAQGKEQSDIEARLNEWFVSCVSEVIEDHFTKRISDLEFIDRIKRLRLDLSECAGYIEEALFLQE